MKRFVLPLFSGLLVLSLLLGSFATAKAAPGDNPTVTPVSGDTDLTTEIIAIASLPGVTELAGGMLAPAGFPAGEAQFGGNGIRVTGMDSGKATACFYLSAAEINQGWGGKVGVWDGTQWVLLATSISLPEETNNAIACATISGNGTYAFIKYVTEPDKLPTVQLPACNYFAFFMPELVAGETIDGVYHGTLTRFLFISLDLRDGMYVTVRSLGTEPPGFIEMPGVGSGVLDYSGFMGYLTLDEPMELTLYPGRFDFWNLYLTFDDCYQVIQFVGPAE
jgi:hypothetical protein